MSDRRSVLRHLCRFIAAAGLWGGWYALSLPCPFRWLTGIPCPTCGTIRAILSLLRGDLRTYLQLQPMAIPLLVAILCCLHIHKANGVVREIMTYAVPVICSANFLLYIFRLR